MQNLFRFSVYRYLIIGACLCSLSTGSACQLMTPEVGKMAPGSHDEESESSFEESAIFRSRRNKKNTSDQYPFRPVRSRIISSRIAERQYIIGRHIFLRAGPSLPNGDLAPVLV